MRIISGKYRGRKLHPPANLPVRPTTDMAREALFNILNNYFDFETLRVLDLFCGTGAISFEFASRGSSDITSVDFNPRCLDFIRKTADHLGVEGLQTIKADVFRYLDLARGPWDLIFADPPFDMKESALIPELIFQRELLAPGGWLIVEHPPDAGFAQHPNFKERRRYGRVNFSVFRKENEGLKGDEGEQPQEE
jgi:16S rRNA (guanine966-N2)-methyltransferase